MIFTGKKRIDKKELKKRIEKKQEKIEKEDENEEFVVEKIVGCRKLKDRPVEYKIRWKRYSKDFDSWELKRMLRCSKKIERFHKKERTWCEKCKTGCESKEKLEKHT